MSRTFSIPPPVRFIRARHFGVQPIETTTQQTTLKVESINQNDISSMMKVKPETVVKNEIEQEIRVQQQLVSTPPPSFVIPSSSTSTPSKLDFFKPASTILREQKSKVEVEPQVELNESTSTSAPPSSLYTVVCPLPYDVHTPAYFKQGQTNIYTIVN
jgi:hypothetical protein